jgi:nitrite reductase/ring-hydroxylating ferredoxin subunit
MPWPFRGEEVSEYHINVFWSAEDDAWIADIPDLTYCSAHGDTPEEALAEVLQAQDAWLESARAHGERVLRSEALPAGEGTATQIRRVRAGEDHVCVARLGDGRLVAFAPSCPHQRTDLDDATVWDGLLRCPRHGYVYDPASGRNVVPARDADPADLWKLRPGYLPCYEVSEADGWISVSAEPLPPPREWDPALEEPPAAAPAESAAPLAVGSAAAEEQSVKFLTVAAGSSFDVRLPTTVRPGFGWDVAVTGDVIRVAEEEFEPGEYPCLRLVLEAGGAGAATLTCTYGETGAGARAEVRTYIVRVSPA